MHSNLLDMTPGLVLAGAIAIILLIIWSLLLKTNAFYEEGDCIKFKPIKRVAGYDTKGNPIHCDIFQGWVMSEAYFRTTKQHILLLDTEKEDNEVDFEKDVQTFIYEGIDDQWFLKSDVDKKCPYTCEIVYQR